MRLPEVRRLWPSFVVSMLVIVLSSPARGFEFALDASVGALFPLEIDHREIYGNGVAFGVGFSPRLPDKDAWIILETGLMASQGRMPSDPTFEFPEETYVLVPILVGIRGNPFTTDRRVKLYFGIAFESLLTWWKRENEDYRGAPTLGLALEIRPEFQVAERLGLWVRNRLSIMPGVRYRDSGIPDLNYSSNKLQAGLSYFFE